VRPARGPTACDRRPGGDEARQRSSRTRLAHPVGESPSGEYEAVLGPDDRGGPVKARVSERGIDGWPLLRAHCEAERCAWLGRLLDARAERRAEAWEGLAQVVVGDVVGLNSLVTHRDVVRRVRPTDVRETPVHHPRHVLGPGRVSAEEAVVAGHDQVPCLDAAILDRLGNFVRVAAERAGLGGGRARSNWSELTSRRRSSGSHKHPGGRGRLPPSPIEAAQPLRRTLRSVRV
jgi:hypothetical protein